MKKIFNNLLKKIISFRSFFQKKDPETKKTVVEDHERIFFSPPVHGDWDYQP